MFPEKKKQPQPLLRGDVLIVDDEQSICEILKEYCVNMGCFRNILIANDGSMASTKLRNQKFALILLDLKMPKKGGLDLLREIDDKSLNSKNSIIIVSGELNKTVIEKLAAAGAKHFLTKPFLESDFQERVLKVFNLK